MNSTPGSWRLTVKTAAQRNQRRAPRHERERLAAELRAIALDPFGGNTQRLHGALEHSYRRRVGDYRILYDVSIRERLIVVTDITRRTSTTYHQRH